MPVPYAVRLALQSLYKEKWINILSVLTIGSVLLIMCVVFLVAYNVNAAAGRLPEKFSMVVFLDETLQYDRIETIITTLKRQTAVSAVRYISKEEALREMKGLLRNSGFILEGLEENPLPPTLELRLRKEAVGTGEVKSLADEALRIKGVKDVQYGEKFLAMLSTIRTGLRSFGTVIIGLLSVTIIFVCYSTVKILFYRKQQEIETFKLLGATRGFIRTPFLLEGAFIGAAAGLICLIVLAVFYYGFFLKLGMAMPFLKVLFFPMRDFLFLPLVGLLLGGTGAGIALGRLSY